MSIKNEPDLLVLCGHTEIITSSLYNTDNLIGDITINEFNVEIFFCLWHLKYNNAYAPAFSKAPILTSIQKKRGKYVWTGCNYR